MVIRIDGAVTTYLGSGFGIAAGKDPTNSNCVVTKILAMNLFLLVLLPKIKRGKDCAVGLLFHAPRAVMLKFDWCQS